MDSCPKCGASYLKIAGPFYKKNGYWECLVYRCLVCGDTRRRRKDLCFNKFLKTEAGSKFSMMADAKRAGSARWRATPTPRPVVAQLKARAHDGN